MEPKQRHAKIRQSELEKTRKNLVAILFFNSSLQTVIYAYYITAYGRQPLNTLTIYHGLS